MNIYKVSQNVNVEDWGKYDSVIVVAENEYTARLIHPEFTWERINTDPNLTLNQKLVKAWCGNMIQLESWWTKFEDVDSLKVEYLGKADKSLETTLVLLGSFNAV